MAVPGQRADGPAGTAILHGGDLGEARRLFPQAPEPWLDLSTGINPVPYPLPPFEASALTRLPAKADLQALKKAAATCYAAPGPDHVVAAPGTQILIGLLPWLRRAGRVAVLGPTYAEHAQAWAAAGHFVDTVGSLDDTSRADVVVVVNPNNPDGRVHDRTALLGLADRLAARGGLLVVDEAFADFETGIGGDLGSHALRLRSFGKSFGLAGLRLGFALGEPALARLIESALGPWAVSGPALSAGLAALRDDGWRRDAAVSRTHDAGRLDRMIARAGGRLVGGTVLFRTAAFDDASGLFRRLGESAILVRRFPEAPDRLRFGLPGSRQAWCRLSRAMTIT